MLISPNLGTISPLSPRRSLGLLQTIKTRSVGCNHNDVNKVFALYNAKPMPYLNRLALVDRQDKRTREESVKYGKGRAGPVDGFYAHLRTLTHDYAHFTPIYADSISAYNKTRAVDRLVFFNQAWFDCRAGVFNAEASWASILLLLKFAETRRN